MRRLALASRARLRLQALQNLNLPGVIDIVSRRPLDEKGERVSTVRRTAEQDRGIECGHGGTQRQMLVAKNFDIQLPIALAQIFRLGKPIAAFDSKSSAGIAAEFATNGVFPIRAVDNDLGD
jgi:hypothetical protein